MRRSAAGLLVAALVAAGCSDDTAEAGDGADATTTLSTTATPVSTTTAPESTMTVDVIEADPVGAATDLLAGEWSTIEPWRDGFVAISADADRLGNVAQITEDGGEWTEVPLPSLAPGEVVASGSDGAELALLLVEREATEFTVSITDDLQNWRDVRLPHPWPGLTQFEVLRLHDGWFVRGPGDAEGTHSWVIDGSDDAVPVEQPAVNMNVDTTEAGVLAWSSDDRERVWFAPDGLVWEERPVPAHVTAVNSVAGVAGGAVVSTYDGNRALAENWITTADGFDWQLADMPVEEPFRFSVNSAHHLAIAQPVGQYETGRGGRILAAPPHVTEVSHDGTDFRFEYVDDRLDISITDATTGEIVGSSTAGFDWGGYRNLRFSDVVSIFDGGALIATLPAEVFHPAEEAAYAAGYAALDPVQRALREVRYVVFSADGRTWTGSIVDTEFMPVVHAVNGTLAVVGVDGEQVVLDLAS